MFEDSRSGFSAASENQWLKKFDEVVDDFRVWVGVGRYRFRLGWRVARLREQVARSWIVSRQGKKNVAPLWAAFFQN
jgi:hypothetical protein